MCIVITYPENYFYDNWYVDLFDRDDANLMKQLKQKIKNEEIYYTPRIRLPDFADAQEAQEDLNEHIRLSALNKDKNVYLSDAKYTKDFKSRRYFMNCLIFDTEYDTNKPWHNRIGVILNECEPLKNPLIIESRNIDGVRFFYDQERCLCPPKKKEKVKNDVELLNDPDYVISAPAVAAPAPAVVAPAPVIVEPVAPVVESKKKKIKIPKIKVKKEPKIKEQKEKKEVKKKEEKKEIKKEEPIEAPNMQKLKEFEELYKGKLTKKAKENKEYIQLKFQSIPPRDSFIKNQPIKQGRKYLSTADRPMNATIKRYIDMIYPEQKYENKLEEMIDKIRLMGLLMRNVEKERARVAGVAAVPAPVAPPAPVIKEQKEEIKIEPKKIKIVKKKEIKKEIKKEVIPQVTPLKAISFADLYNYFQDYMKKRKEGVKETAEDKKIKKQKIADFRIYIRNLREQKNATKNVFNKKDLEKQIKGYQELLNALSNRNPKMDE